MIFSGAKNKEIMMLFVFLVLCSLSLQELNSQVVIGSEGPVSEGALLELKENNNLGTNASKGLLLPRVALKSLSLMSPMLDDDNLEEGEKKSILGLLSIMYMKITEFNCVKEYMFGLLIFFGYVFPSHVVFSLRR